MNALELLKLIQQIETGKNISIVKESVEVIKEAQQNPVIEQIQGLKSILILGIIAITVISIITTNNYEMDLSSIIGKIMFGITLTFCINFGINSALEQYIPNTTSENKQTRIVEKEVRKNATSEEIKSWKK